MVKSRHNEGSGGLLTRGWYKILQYYIVPPLFIVLFTVAVQWLAILGDSICPFDQQQCSKLLGDSFSWTVVGAYITWVIVWLNVPSKQFVGPESPEGEKPVYQDNGFLFFTATMIAFFTVRWFRPSLSHELVLKNPENLATLSLLALLLCVWLALKAKLKGKMTNYPLIYNFYRGSELHPKVMGCDAKQFAVSRVGMMVWQLLILTAFLESNFNMADTATFLMQTIYIAKFFWWESGYFTTLDVTYDRAGYYLCWGGMVWIPALFPLSQIHLIHNPSNISDTTAILITCIGLAATFLEYAVDHQKQVFVEWRNKFSTGKKESPYLVWGSHVKYIKSTYINDQGKTVHSALLTSGYWGLARHFNYTCELLCALLWCLPAFISPHTRGVTSHLPMFYFYFILGLMAHRILRDEHKCKAKYGIFWDQYCALVPYRFIPYIF
ncbi:hypothetical protein B566_EDAN009931 [Ephemera danica]|nr:hypothetical protein B566_EDAN009931 [Ephemera danica]